MKRLLSFLLLIAVVYPSWSQTKLRPDYIITEDTISFQGEILFDINIPSKVILKTGDILLTYFESDIHTFRANELIGFGTSSHHYLSREIIDTDNLKKDVFLEIHILGEVKLFTLPGTTRMYIEESSLVEINRNNYREVLGNLSGCQESSHITDRLPFTFNAIKDFIEAYNMQECDLTEVRHFGFSAGFGLASIQITTPEVKFSNFTMRSTDTFSAGVVFIRPIWSLSRILVRFDAGFTRTYFSEELAAVSQYKDLTLLINTINFSIAPVYRLGERGVRPYLLAGGAAGFTLSAESSEINYADDSGIITYFRQENNYIPEDFSFGFIAGTGLTIPLTSLQLDAGIRYSYFSNDYPHTLLFTTTLFF